MIHGLVMQVGNALKDEKNLGFDLTFLSYLQEPPFKRSYSYNNLTYSKVIYLGLKRLAVIVAALESD